MVAIKSTHCRMPNDEIRSINPGRGWVARGDVSARPGVELLVDDTRQPQARYLAIRQALDEELGRRLTAPRMLERSSLLTTLAHIKIMPTRLRRQVGENQTATRTWSSAARATSSSITEVTRVRVPGSTSTCKVCEVR